jgi:hypothetical protein
MLQRFLDDSVTYTESVIDPEPVEFAEEQAQDIFTTASPASSIAGWRRIVVALEYDMFLRPQERTSACPILTVLRNYIHKYGAREQNDIRAYVL